MSAVVHFTNTGRILKPYAPVHLGGGRDASGQIVLQWVRRTRVGGAWLNGTDVPLGEANELYRVNLYSASYASLLASFQVSAPTRTITTAEQTTYYSGLVSPLYWGVQQVGMLGAGYESRTTT